MVALRLRSYLGQPQAPLVANATQAACIVSARCCGGSAPRSGPKTGLNPLSSVSKTKAISSPWQAPTSPLNSGERQAKIYGIVQDENRDQ